MSFRTRLALLAAVVMAAASTLAAGPVSAEPAGWTPPTPIPGTAGRANPLTATAPDGAELLLWAVSGSVSPQNTVLGKVLKAGSDRWQRVPSPMVDKPYGSANVIAPTHDGDFWVVFTWETADGFEIYLSRLDTSTRDWTKLRRVFHDTDYSHDVASLAVSGNGTLYVGATAKPHVSTSPPTYRAQVATKRPGDPWKTKFLSPADDFAVLRNVVANAKGQAVAAFIQGYELADMRVRAATRGAGATSKWKLADLSVAGGSQRAHAAIGPDGTAAVEWSAPSTGYATVRVAAFTIGAGGPWLFADAATGGGSNIATAPVVNRDGSVTALWETYDNPDSLLYARQLTDGMWEGPATPFSQAGMRATLASARLRPDGDVAVLFQQFSGGLADEGMRLRLLDRGSPGGALVLTDAGDGAANSIWHGIDAAQRNHVLWTRGSYPDTDFATMGDPLGRPAAMTSVRSGVEATAAKVAGGPMRVGRRVTCTTGFWVEAEGVGYRWFRDGARIKGETGRRYVLVAKDRGDKVSCRAKATSDFGTHVLSSPGRRVR